MSSLQIPTLRERFRGCLMGLAVGDAVGTTVEFKSPGTFQPVADMVGGGPFNLRVGEWTDDTSMALCLADSLLACDGFNAMDQMERYVRWRDTGYRSSTGACFDIGSTVAGALRRFEASRNPFSGSAEPQTAGNGSLMRLAPVALFFSMHSDKATEAAALSSRTTHGARTAVDACRYFAGLLVGALRGETRQNLLCPLFRPGEEPWPHGVLAPEIEEVASGSFRERHPPDIVGSGYVVRSLEAALWAFHRADGFHDGCLSAVNLGDDADTTGAIYGQIAGAYWGIRGIPEMWIHRVKYRDEILSVADDLLRLRPQ